MNLLTPRGGLTEAALACSHPASAPTPAPAHGRLGPQRAVSGAGVSRLAVLCLTAAALLTLPGCGKRDAGRIDVTSPKEAASGLEQAFKEAPAPVQENVKAVSDAMRRGAYDQAVMSLQVVRDQGATATVEQGMAVHGAMVSMESQLIQAIQSGDANAARAYELLRAMKRK